MGRVGVKGTSQLLLMNAIFIFVTGAAAAATVSVDVRPPVTVARAGESINVQCRVGLPLQYCRIEHTAPTAAGGRGGQQRPPSWNLKEGFPETGDGVLYFGEGLSTGQCGFTVRRLPANFNGGFRCTMGFQNSPDEAIGTFNITVAVAPRAPELIVTKSGGGSSRQGNDYRGSSWNSYSQNEFNEGDTLSAYCSVKDARPVANISWFLDDQEIYRGTTQPLIKHSQSTDLYTVEQNLTMQISWKEHGKNLRCVAGHIANEENNQTSAPISVRFPPRPHSTSYEQFGFVVGATGDIPVEINANPKPTITWKIDDVVLEENREHEDHFHAQPLINNGTGSWTAILRISDVTHQDIERKYTLKARNDLGAEEYSIRLSTSSEPSVMSLEAGAIIGIVVAILVLLLAIFLLVFARTTGRWCFAGGVSKQDPKESVKFLPEEGDPAKEKVQNDENAPLAATTNVNESSDTESADHGPSHLSKKSKTKFTNIFKKKGDKVGDDFPMTKEVDSPISQRPTQQSQNQPTQQRQNAPDSIVYAELDLKDLGERRPQVRPDEERTEYAEILYTAKTEGEHEHTSPPQP